MLRKPLYFTLLLIVVFVVSLQSSQLIQALFMQLTDSVKMLFITTYESADDYIKRHWQQAESITGYQQQVLQCEQRNLELADQLGRQRTMLGGLQGIDAGIAGYHRARTISYVRLGDYYRVWIDYPQFQQEKIYGLIQKDYAAGILLEKNGRPLGLLNGDEQCSYGVYIGESKAPGIIRGKGFDQYITAGFIPAWINIGVGDEVVTSGVDGIFAAGIKVGNVVRIEQSEGYKVAVIKPYADSLHPGYFWVVDEPGS